MGIFSFEYTMKGMTVDRAMKICLVACHLAPEVLPQFFAKTEVLEGNGNVGSTRLVTLGPAVPVVAGMTVKEKVTLWDEATSTYSYENMDDPNFSKFIYTMKFKPGPDGTSTVIFWQLEYEQRDPAIPAPEGVKLVGIELMKAFEKYTLEHPEYP